METRYIKTRLRKEPLIIWGMEIKKYIFGQETTKNLEAKKNEIEMFNFYLKR